MRSLVQSRQLNEEDAVEGLRAANTFFDDGKGVKNSDRERQLWLLFYKHLVRRVDIVKSIHNLSALFNYSVFDISVN